MNTVEYRVYSPNGTLLATHSERPPAADGQAMTAVLINSSGEEIHRESFQAESGRWLRDYELLRPMMRWSNPLFPRDEASR